MFGTMILKFPTKYVQSVQPICIAGTGATKAYVHVTAFSIEYQTSGLLLVLQFLKILKCPELVLSAFITKS
jgi:hypothetical protein